MLLDELEKEKKDLQDKLSTINAKIKTEKLRLAEKEYGVMVGCVVKGRDNKQYKVTSIDTSWRRPWVKGNPMKKDGSWSKAELNVCGDWEVVA